MTIVLSQEVLREYRDIRIAFGQSDEYSFVFQKHTELYGKLFSTRQPACIAYLISTPETYQLNAPREAGRREAKLVTLVVSCFSASYARFWSEFLPETALTQTPSFDGRAVCYPTDQTLRDYLSWRQVDTHINTQVCCTLALVLA